MAFKWTSTVKSLVGDGPETATVVYEEGARQPQSAAVASRQHLNRAS